VLSYTDRRRLALRAAARSSSPRPVPPSYEYSTAGLTPGRASGWSRWAREHVDDERYVHEPAPCGHVCQIGYPRLVAADYLAELFDPQALLAAVCRALGDGVGQR
jgi:hypothetical protein